MKVIDLLNKIAKDEEVPKKIKVYDDVFKFVKGNYYNEKYVDEFLNEEDMLGSCYILDKMLNDEVEIIEEEKEIEEFDDDAITLGSCRDKINELVREVNKLKKEGK